MKSNDAARLHLRIARGCAAAVLAMSAGVLAGWALGIEPLKRVLPGLTSMKANAAVSFALLALALLSLAAPAPSRRRTLAARGLALAAAAIGALTLAEYATGASLGLDELLFRDPENASHHPGRLAPLTAICLVSLGAALAAGRGGGVFGASQAGALVAGFVGFLALVGYAFGAHVLYGMAPYSRMALHTAVACVLLGCGTLLVPSERGVIAFARGDTIAARMVRGLAPFAALGPVVVCWLEREGERRGLFGPAAGAAIFVASVIGIFLAIVTRVARHAESIELAREAERARANAEIRASLREKEVLLKEVHHRVKNNLQVIASLLRLQSRKLADAPARAALADTEARVLSMAIFHEKLYRSADLAAIDAREYVREVVEGVRAAYGGAAARCVVEADDLAFGVDTAVPCGLIVNELVSNAFKHGLRGGREGTVEVALRRSGGEVTLRVHDDGEGLPAGGERRTSSLGLQLVAGLARQLGGELAVSPGPGAAFTVTFPLRAA